MAHAGQVLCLLRGVPCTVAAGLGQAVHLGHKEALLHHIAQHLGGEHGSAAGQHAQTVQAVAAALHHVAVDALQQHRHHCHHLAVHGTQITVEILQVVAQVDGVAGDAPRNKAGHGGDVEHGQGGQGRELVGVPARVLLHIVKGVQEGRHGAEQVLLAQHDALAAAGGAGGEHDKGQSREILHLGHVLGRLIGRKSVHGLQDAAVGLSESRLPLRKLAIVQDAHRLGEAQLVGDGVPVLAQVQRRRHRTGNDRAVHADDVLVAVAGQNRHTLAAHVAVLGPQKSHEPAQVLGIFCIVYLGHSLLVFIIPAQRHAVCDVGFHIAKRLIQ